MAEAGVIQSRSVVVDSHGAVCNLVASVTIDISYTQVVVALPGITVPLRLVGVEHPVLFEFLTVPVPGSDDATGIVAAAEDGRCMLAVQIAHGSQHTVRAVGIVVAPVLGSATLWHVRFGIHRFASQSVKNGDIIRPGQDTACHGPPFLVIFAPFLLRTGCRALLASLVTVVSLSVAYDVSLAVSCSVGSANDELCPPVTVQVIDDERHIVGSAADVDTHVDAPEQRTVQPIAVEEGRAGISVMSIVVGIRRIPFQNNLILSVTVNICH